MNVASSHPHAPGGQSAHYARMLLRRVTHGEEAGDEQVLPGINSLCRLLAEREVELDEVLADVVREAGQAFMSDRATLYLVDHARQELVSHILQAGELTEIRLRLGEGIAGWVARNGTLVNVPHGRTDPRFLRRVDAQSGYITRSILAAPVALGNGLVVGVLQLLNKKRTVFSPEDEQGVAALCRELGALLEASSLRSQLRPDQRQPLSWRFNHIIGESPVMQRVYEHTTRAAATDATVLIRGESGTGKELVARAVHYNSQRRDAPFVTVDCASLPANLIENELFGHERGAYTGADRAQDGKVQAADGGTLFLDEVGELPLSVQAKLLRLVQERTFSRVGSSQARTVDVRFVCATHRDLAALAARGEFRQDLYYRLRVIELQLPPLRARGHADLDRLIDHFLFELAARHKRPGVHLTRAARAALHAHAWPGNVRELQHCLESAVVLSPGLLVDADALTLASPAGSAAAPDAAGCFRTTSLPLREVERAYVRHVLAECGGNRSEAARRLGIGRNTLLRKLKDDED